VDYDSQFMDKEREDPLVTLQQRYPIRYRNPQRVPVQLLITGNKLHIRFFVRYSKSLLENFPGTNVTYADIAESGIRKNWGGLYYFPWLADDGFERAHAKANVRILDNNEDPSEEEISPLQPSVRVNVEFVRFGSSAAASGFPKQHFYRVKLTSGSIFPAHVISPLWRWYWGFFRTLQFESLHLNWSRNHPGIITLQKEQDRYSFQQITAHETGHLLGLGDAYGASYRFFYEAPGTGSYMMCHNRKVRSAELEMVFHSHMTNHMQYFPRKFQYETFISGLRREYQLQFQSLAKNSRNRH